MKYELLKDPYFYMNYLSAAFGIFVMVKLAPSHELFHKNRLNFILRFAFVFLAVIGSLYLCQKFGDISLEKMKATK